MTQINQLSSISSIDLTSADNLVIFSNSNGDSRKLSVAQFISYIRTNLASPTYTKTILTPIDGFNIEITQDGLYRWLQLRPTIALNSGTVVLPATGVATDGQEILITTISQISSFTLNGNGASEINGAPSVLAAGDGFKMKYDLQTTSWNRIT